jgi:hypothetical protein
MSDWFTTSTAERWYIFVKTFKFRSFKSLQAQNDKYFQDSGKKERIYTVTGLFKFLDHNRQTLII